MAGSIALIVFLGRGISTNRTAARGLAVPPSERRPRPRCGARLRREPAPQPRPVLRLHALAGTDLQALVGLRVCLAILILLSVGSMTFTFVSIGRFGGYGGYGSSLAMQLTLRSILGLLPPIALLVAVSVRNPPAGVALDAAGGFGIASILFRFGYLAFAGVFLQAFRHGDYGAHDAAAAGRLQPARSRHRRARALRAQPRRADQTRLR